MTIKQNQEKGNKKSDRGEKSVTDEEDNYKEG
jgi:hypothetical protein